MEKNGNSIQIKSNQITWREADYLFPWGLEFEHFKLTAVVTRDDERVPLFIRLDLQTDNNNKKYQSQSPHSTTPVRSPRFDSAICGGGFHLVDTEAGTTVLAQHASRDDLDLHGINGYEPQ